MGFFKKIFKPVRKIAKKIIPKELKPFLPYLAASFGPAGLASSGIFSNPALTKAIIAGTTAAATDEDANILRTAMLAGAPDALSQGLGKFSQTYGAVGDSADKFNMLTKAADYAGKGKQMIDNAGLLKTVGAQGGIDMSIKAAELNQKKIDEYNANLLSQGIKDKGARRSAIFDIFINAGHDSEDVNVMLDKYGYADGGRAGYRYGKSVKKKKTSIKKKAPPSAGITTIEVDAEIDKDGDKDQMSMEEFVEMMKGGEDEGMSLGDSLDYAKQGLGMLQGDVAPVPIMRFADGGFGGIEEAVESVREKAVGRDDYNFMDLIDEEGEEKYYQEREDKINDLLEQGYSFEEVREMLNMRVPGMKEGGRTKKKKKKYKYKRDGMEFDKPLGPDGTFNTGNPPKRYEVAEGGMMSVLPKNKEMDYRQGGMIPMGSKERADDVPARLSKNEFVMTADAVRAAGGGSINKGAKRMYNLMNNLEARV